MQAQLERLAPLQTLRPIDILIPFLGLSPPVLYTLLYPTTANDGRASAPEHLRWIEDAITRRFGGLTRFFPGTGYWVPPSGNPKRDGIVPIQVVAPGGPATEAWLLGLAAKLAQRLNQDEIFVFGQSVQMVDATTLTLNGALANGLLK